MSHSPGFEYERRLEDRAVKARRRMFASFLLFACGVLGVLTAAFLLRNRLVDVPAGVVALAAGWALAAIGSACSAYIALRSSAVLPRVSIGVGLAPWAVICLVATIVIAGYL